MSRALRPVPPDETQRMAAKLVQAVRANQSEDQLVALMNDFIERMLNGRERLNSLADMKSFLISVAYLWLDLARTAVLIGQPGTTSDGADVALQILALNLTG